MLTIHVFGLTSFFYTKSKKACLNEVAYTKYSSCAPPHWRNFSNK